jgi:hypothetical protein
VGEVVWTFLWDEEIDDAADGGPETVDRSLGGFAQQDFELGKGVLNRIEVRAIGRRVDKAAPAASILSRTFEPCGWTDRP